MESIKLHPTPLNPTPLWANSADHTLMIIFFLIFTQKKGFDISFHVSFGDNLHELSKPVFLEKYFEISAEIFTQHAKH